MERTASNLVDEIKKLSRQDQAAIIVEVLDTLDEPQKVIAAMRLGIEGPYRFEGREWSKL